MESHDAGALRLQETLILADAQSDFLIVGILVEGPEYAIGFIISGNL